MEFSSVSQTVVRRTPSHGPHTEKTFFGAAPGVSKYRGGNPPKWMVYNEKPYEQMDDLGVPLFLETPMS